MIAFGFTFTHFLSPGSASENSVLIFLTVGMFIMGLIFGPMSAVLPELSPPTCDTPDPASATTLPPSWVQP